MAADRTHCFQICSATFARNPAVKIRYSAANSKNVSNKRFTLASSSSACSKQTVCSFLLFFLLRLSCFQLLTQFSISNDATISMMPASKKALKGLLHAYLDVVLNSSVDAPACGFARLCPPLRRPSCVCVGIYTHVNTIPTQTIINAYEKLLFPAPAPARASAFMGFSVHRQTLVPPFVLLEEAGF